MFEELLARRDVLTVDTETTGFGADAQVIQIAVINTRGKVLMNDLVRVSDKIPKRATQIHSWTRGKLRQHGVRQWVKVSQAKEATSPGYRGSSLERPLRRAVDFPDGQLQRLVQSTLQLAMLHANVQTVAAGPPIRTEGCRAIGGVRVGKRHDALADCRMTLAVMRAVANSSDEGKQVTNQSGHKRGCLGFVFR
ncbi:MAG: hypothetical protein F4Y80_08725 [Caldilineaceae bacterium SB0665_bin_21]|nr:hypothetical protein [Caldilineaceae bacterium SB0665_bin_21]MYA05605.1 hypothetical protein [Caldilineaceae bacterium SB0664_bin_22]MYC62214.1 hypothetical protein [Caldilineaceae bacterium SB0661_bin_34]